MPRGDTLNARQKKERLRAVSALRHQQKTHQNQSATASESQSPSQGQTEGKEGGKRASARASSAGPSAARELLTSQFTGQRKTSFDSFRRAQRFQGYMWGGVALTALVAYSLGRIYSRNRAT